MKVKGGTWPWREHDRWWHRQDHKRSRRTELDEADQQIEDLLTDAADEAEWRSVTEAAAVARAGYVSNERRCRSCGAELTPRYRHHGYCRDCFGTTDAAGRG